jgi:hypothetical protein
MTTADDINDNQIIQCPRCRESVTVSELGEHVNSNPHIKQQAIEEQLQSWEIFPGTLTML